MAALPVMKLTVDTNALRDAIDVLVGRFEPTPIYDALWDEFGAGVRAAGLAAVEAEAAAQAAWGGAP